MKTETKQNWLNALRSGEYSQDKFYLRTEIGYCCLGVLCDITKAGSWKEIPASDIKPKRFEIEGQTKYLSDDLRNFVGLDNRALHRLMSMNDDGVSFDSIAGWIEANVPAE